MKLLSVALLFVSLSRIILVVSNGINNHLVMAWRRKSLAKIPKHQLNLKSREDVFLRMHGIAGYNENVRIE